MIRAANHSSYPRFEDDAPDVPLRAVLAARERGEVGDAEVTEVEDEVTTLVVAEQSRAFVNIVTDGMIRWSDPLDLVVRNLSGLRPGTPTPWFDTSLSYRRPICTAAVRRGSSFLMHGFEVAQDVAQVPLKVVLPGPVTLARLTDDRHYHDVAELAEAIAGALAVEVADLVAAKAVHFQLDEPLLCRHPEDLDLVCRTAGRIFTAAGGGATTELSTYFGTLDAIADRLDRLPGTHLGIDAVSADGALELLRRLPPGKGVSLGLFDAGRAEAEDAEGVASRLAVHRERLTERDVIVGPQAGLAGLSRDDAFEKLLQARYLVEQLGAEWSWSGPDG